MTKRAEEELENLYENIKQRASEDTAKQFVREFKETTNHLKSTPEIFPKSKTKPNVRRGLFGKTGAFLYRNFTKIVRIITVYDTRMDR